MVWSSCDLLLWCSIMYFVKFAIFKFNFKSFQWLWLFHRFFHKFSFIFFYYEHKAMFYYEQKKSHKMYSLLSINGKDQGAISFRINWSYWKNWSPLWFTWLLEMTNSFRDPLHLPPHLVPLAHGPAAPPRIHCNAIYDVSQIQAVSLRRKHII